MEVFSLTLRPLYFRENCPPPYVLNWRLCGYQRSSGISGDGINLVLCQESKRDFSDDHSLHTELSQVYVYITVIEGLPFLFEYSRDPFQRKLQVMKGKIRK